MVLRSCILFLRVECYVVSVRIICFMKFIIYNISLFTFCMDDLSIVKRGVLKSTTIEHCVRVNV